MMPNYQPNTKNNASQLWGPRVPPDKHLRSSRLKAKVVAVKLTFLHMMWLLLIFSMCFDVAIASCGCEILPLTYPVMPTSPQTVQIGGGTATWTFDAWIQSNSCTNTDNYTLINQDSAPLPDWITLNGNAVEVTPTDINLHGQSETFYIENRFHSELDPFEFCGVSYDSEPFTISFEANCDNVTLNQPVLQDMQVEDGSIAEITFTDAFDSLGDSFCGQRTFSVENQAGILQDWISVVQDVAPNNYKIIASPSSTSTTIEIKTYNLKLKVENSNWAQVAVTVDFELEVVTPPCDCTLQTFTKPTLGAQQMIALGSSVEVTLTLPTVEIDAQVPARQACASSECSTSGTFSDFRRWWNSENPLASYISINESNTVITIAPNIMDNSEAIKVTFTPDVGQAPPLEYQAVSFKVTCEVTSWDVVPKISHTMVLFSQQTQLLFQDFVQVPACGYTFTYTYQSFTLEGDDEVMYTDTITIDQSTNSLALSAQNKDFALDSRNPFKLMVNQKLTLTNNPWDSSSVPTIYDNIDVEYELTITNPCTTATIDPVVFNPTSLTVMDQYTGSASFDIPSNSVDTAYTGTDLCGLRLYRIFRNGYDVTDTQTYLDIYDPTPGDQSKSLRFQTANYDLNKSVEQSGDFVLRTSLQEYPTIFVDATINVTFQPLACICSTLKWNDPTNIIDSTTRSTAGNLLPAGTDGQGYSMTLAQFVPDTSNQSDEPAFNYCYNYDNTSCGTGGYYNRPKFTQEGQEETDLPDWISFTRSNSIVQTVGINPPFDESLVGTHKLRATFVPENGISQNAYVLEFRICSCGHLNWIAPAHVSAAEAVSQSDSQEVTIPVPTADFSARDTNSDFADCIDAQWCQETGYFSFKSSTQDNQSPLTVLPVWMTFTSSGTTEQNMTFQPRNGLQIGTHVVELTFDPLYGSSLDFTAVQLTVSCQVTSITWPEATNSITNLSGLNYPQFVLAYEKTYDLSKEDPMDAQSSAIIYTQVPDCRYDLENQWNWTIINQDTASNDISAFTFADGSADSNAILKVHATQLAQAGIYTIKLANQVTILSNGPVSNSLFTPANVDSEKLIYDNFEIKNACELTDVILYDATTTISTDSDWEVTVEQDLNLLSSIFFKFNPSHGTHFDDSVQYNILAGGAPFCGPMTHEISSKSPLPENGWLVSDTLQNGIISVRPLDPPQLASVTFTMTTWSNAEDPKPEYNILNQVYFMLGDCDRVLTEDTSQAQKQCIVDDDDPEVAIETQYFKFGSQATTNNHSCGGTYTQTISDPSSSTLSIDNGSSKILCSNPASQNVPYFHSGIEISADWAIGDSPTITQTTQIEIEAIRKEMEIVENLLGTEKSYIGMKIDVKETITNQFSFLQNTKYRVEFYFVNKANFEYNDCKLKENWFRCFQGVHDSYISIGNINSFFKAELLTSDDIEVTVFKNLQDRTVITEWYLVALVQNLDINQNVISGQYGSAKGWLFQIDDPCMSDPAVVEVASFTPWTIQNKDEEILEAKSIYLMQSLILKFNEVQSEKFDAATLYEQMSDDSFKVCGTIVSSNYVTTPSDPSNDVTLTHTEDSKITINNIGQAIAVKINFTLGYADSLVTVEFADNYESTLMIGNCDRVLNYEEKYTWHGGVTNVVRELEPTLFVPLDIFTFQSCSELSQYKQTVGIDSTESEFVMIGISIQNEDTEILDNLQTTIKISEDGGIFFSVNSVSAEPSSLKETSGLATVTVESTWKIFDIQMAQRSHTFQLKIITLWTGQDLSLQLEEVNTTSIMNQADDTENKMFIIAPTIDRLIATYSFKKDQVAFQPSPYTAVDSNYVNIDQVYTYESGDIYPESRGHKGELYTNDGNPAETQINQECLAWNRTVSDTIITFNSTVFNDIDEDINDLAVVFNCAYEKCSNFPYEEEIGHGLTIELQEEYFVHYGSQKLDLPVIDSFCYYNRAQWYFSAELQYAENQGGELVIFEDDIQLEDYGIQIVSQNMTAYLQFYSSDEQLWDSVFTIVMNSTLSEQPEWTNTNIVKLSMFRAPCHVTQEFVTDTTAGMSISMIAPQNSNIEYDFSNEMVKIDTAFWTKNQTTDVFCGELVQIISDLDDETPFIRLPVTQKNILLAKPAWNQVVQVYESASLFFYLSEFPDRYTNIPITVDVTLCTWDNVQFTQSKVLVQQVIGEPFTEINFPEITSTPDCGIEISLKSPVRESKKSIEGYQKTNLLYSIYGSKKIVQVLQVNQISLLGEQFSDSISFDVEEFKISFVLAVEYITNGPSFLADQPSLPSICCCSEDKNWKLAIPAFKLESQQSIQVNLLQDDEFSKLFLISENTIVVNPLYTEALSEGKICPSQENFAIKLEAISDKLDRAQFNFEGTITKPVAASDNSNQSKSDKVFVFDFEQNIEGTLEQATKIDFELPTVTLQSISNKGLVVLQFSDAMIIKSDLTVFKQTRISDDGITQQNNLDIQVIAEEYDDERNIKFDWSVTSFTSRQMKIQLNFESAVDISEGAYPDTLEIIFYDPKLLTRAIDGALIVENTILSKDLPKIFDATANQALKSSAVIVENSGKGTLIVLVIANYFLQLYLNTVLSLIRVISMLVHFLAINLNTPESTEIFFATIFELVSFDLIPTDGLYESWFGFQNLPLSDTFDAVGYSSQFIIWNLGSIFLFLLAEIVLQLFYAMLGFIAPTNSRVEQWAKNKTKSFFWAGLITFYNEIYICMSFSSIINLYDMQLRGQQTSVLWNNIFAISMAVTLFFGPVAIVLGLKRSWRATDEQIENMYLKFSAKFNTLAIQSLKSSKTILNASSTIDNTLSIMNISNLTQNIQKVESSSESSELDLGEQKNDQNSLQSESDQESSQPALLGIFQPKIKNFQKQNELEISESSKEEDSSEELNEESEEPNQQQSKPSHQSNSQSAEEFKKKKVSDLKQLEQYDQELIKQEKQQFLPYLEGGESVQMQPDGSNLLEVLAAQRARDRIERLQQQEQQREQQQKNQQIEEERKVSRPSTSIEVTTESPYLDENIDKLAQQVNKSAMIEVDAINAGQYDFSHMRARYEMERLNEYDEAVARNFGPLIEQFPSRVILNRKMAYIYVGLNFYRRLSLPMVIILVKDSSALSIIIVLQINVYYNAFVLGNNFYNDRQILIQETQSEILVIFTIYILMVFVEQYITEIQMRNDLGYVVISMAVLILLVNLLPITLKLLVKMKNKICLKCFGKCCKKDQKQNLQRLKSLRRKSLYQMEKLDLSDLESQKEAKSDSDQDESNEADGSKKIKAKNVKKRIAQSKKMSKNITDEINAWCSQIQKDLINVLKEKEAKLGLSLAKFNREQSTCSMDRFRRLTEGKLKCDKDFQAQLMLVQEFTEIMQLTERREQNSEWTTRDQSLYDFSVKQELDMPEVLVFNYELNRDMLLVEKHILEEQEEQSSEEDSETKEQQTSSELRGNSSNTKMIDTSISACSSISNADEPEPLTKMIDTTGNNNKQPKIRRADSMSNNFSLQKGQRRRAQ